VQPRARQPSEVIAHDSDTTVLLRVRREVESHTLLRLPAPCDVLAVCFGFELRPGVRVTQRVTGKQLAYDLARADHGRFIAIAIAHRALRRFATRSELARLPASAAVNLAVMLCG